MKKLYLVGCYYKPCLHGANNYVYPFTSFKDALKCKEEYKSGAIYELTLVPKKQKKEAKRGGSRAKSNSEKET